jgi:hypothetical protein
MFSYRKKRQLCLPIHLEARTLLKFKEIVTVLSDQSVTRSVPFSRSFSQLSDLTDFNQFSVCVKYLSIVKKNCRMR